MLLKGIISKDMQVLQPSYTLEQSIALIKEQHVKHLPVVKGKKYLGLVNLDELVREEDLNVTLNQLELNAQKGYISNHTHIFEIMRLAADLKQTSIPVLNAKDEYAGTIRVSDLVHLLANHFAFDQPGGILVLEVHPHNYSLTEIAGIIESNDAKIITLFTHYGTSTNMLDVNIKVNKEEIEPILQTFERYNYHVKAVYSDHHMAEELKDRYNALLNYLNI